MKLAKGALNRVVSRPFIIVFSVVLSLLYCIVDFLNPLIAVIFGFSAMGEGDLLGTVISLIQLALSPALLMKAGLWIIAGVVLAALVTGLLFSGYFYILKNTLENAPRKRGEYFEGIKKYFGRIFRTNLAVLSLSVVFLVFLIVLSVPALFVSWSWQAGKAELFGMMLLLDILTVVVVFFIFMFFRLYLSYWYPAVYSFQKGSFRMAKNIVEGKFWILVGRWVLIDILFILVEVLFLNLRYRISLGGESGPVLISMLFAGKLVTAVLFFSTVTTFLFASFRTISSYLTDKNQVQ